MTAPPAPGATALPTSRVLDVIVVGAGLAGLRAAHDLAAGPGGRAGDMDSGMGGGLDVLVLERDGRAGGRVRTEHHGGFVLDLGAVLPYRAGDAPPGSVPGPVLPGPSRLALVIGDRVHIGADPEDCLRACGLPEPPPAVLEALFQRIHVGPPAAYLPGRVRDAFAPYSTAYRRAGNGELVHALLTGTGPGLRVAYGVSAEAVDRSGGLVRVRCRDRDGTAVTLSARAAVVATPGPATLALLDGAAGTAARSRAFLASLRYGPATVCALAFRARPRLPWAYAVTPDLSATMVLARDMGPGVGTVLQAYFMAHKAGPAAALSDAELCDRTQGLLRRLALGDRDRARNDGRDGGKGLGPVVAHAVARWPAAGTIVSPASYGTSGTWHPAVRRPLPGVFLAGDYAGVRGDCPLPYGMAAALASGREAAAGVRAYLAGPLPPPDPPTGPPPGPEPGPAPDHERSPGARHAPRP
ncbi:FAD-dependent oxidoreductase [Streptomyces sp. NPDC000594]|uniref:FAD-dependent oxidoreductase n=1 Tax=Streptomyces sp. NPDC000594 TaxID=3154261 RepID=UPI00332D093A